MKTPISATESGLIPEPHAFFLHSGAYSSFVLTAVPSDDENILAPMEDGNLWGSDCVQLTESAAFFSIGSDAVNQAISVYLDTTGKTDPPDRALQATFLSKGEQVYLESLLDMTFREDCDQFFLPEGEYKVDLLSWNLGQARDNFDADPKLFLENVHHELHFTGSASLPAKRRTIHGRSADEHASF